MARNPLRRAQEELLPLLQGALPDAECWSAQELQQYRHDGDGGGGAYAASPAGAAMAIEGASVHAAAPLKVTAVQSGPMGPVPNFQPTTVAMVVEDDAHDHPSEIQVDRSNHQVLYQTPKIGRASCRERV